MNLVTLNPEQTEAIQHGEGPLLIIAGAGTGKTTVITERIKSLITERSIRPDQILALTFTEKAAYEMEERIDKIMPYGYSHLWISTFHAFCDNILRDEAIHMGLTPNFQLMTEAESILFLRRHLFALDLKYFRPLGNPNKFLEALLQHFARLTDEDITPDEYIKFATSLKAGTTTVEKEEAAKILELSHAFKEYENLKVKEGMLDFSDLISQTLNLLRKRSSILRKYQEQFKYILIDEFQDTNFAQNEMAIKLAGKRKNITVVADDDQAIYRWRGAALSNVIQFRNNFPGARLITLTRNYRSTQEILDRSYTMIQNNNPYRLEEMENISKKLTSDREIKGAPVELIIAQRVDEEAEEIAQTIQNLVAKKKYIYSDIAILVRANNHAQPITQTLQRLHIPYQFLGPSFLLHQEEIKDLIAYLKVLYDLSDSVSMFRILNMDVFGLSAREISYLLSSARKQNLTLFEAMQKVGKTNLSNFAKNKIEEICKMIDRHLERIKKDTAGQILYYFLIDTKLFDRFTNITTAKQEQEAQNVAKFFDRIKAFETVNYDKNIYAVVDWIDLMMELGESPIAAAEDWRDVNAVNILTIHSSKGLEFPVVFLPNLVNDRFPTRERKEKIPLPSQLIKEVLPEGDFHLMEERRLFYVGMTRARDLLFLTAAKFYGEGKREKKISPFVYEALPEQMAKHTAPTKKAQQLSLIELTQGYLKTPIEAESPFFKDNAKLDIDYLSYSHLSSFDICPLHYKAGVILKIPTTGSAALSFGTSIHETLKEFYNAYKARELLNKDELRILLRKHWKSEGYQNKTHESQMFDHGVDILRNYYDKEIRGSNPPLAVELPFSFTLDKNDPESPNTAIKTTGIIDRIDKKDGNQIEIIDYKTGQPNTISKSKYMLQLGVYALAATKVEHEILKRKPNEITVTLYYLETGDKISSSINPDELLIIENKLRTKVKEIEQSNFACSHNIICKNCEYKMLCDVS